MLKRWNMNITGRGLNRYPQAMVEKHNEMTRDIDKLKEMLFDLQNHDTA